MAAALRPCGWVDRRAALRVSRRGPLPSPPTCSPLPLAGTEIAALEAERKALIGAKLNEKHANWGSVLLGLGVTIAVSGPLNTFFRTGEPGWVFFVMVAGRRRGAWTLLRGLCVLPSSRPSALLHNVHNAGKLFPGPHLYAGAAITVLWALAAALVPAMQKGNEGARSAHIALNCINILLFAWQIPTGLEIVAKVFEFTSWP